MKTLAVSGTHGHTHTSGTLAARNVFWEVWEHWPGSGSDTLGPTLLQRLTDRTPLHCDHFIPATWREGSPLSTLLDASWRDTQAGNPKGHASHVHNQCFSSDTPHFPPWLLQPPPHRLSPHRPWAGLPTARLLGKGHILHIHRHSYLNL